MARDPLRILQTVRRRSVEAARYALGACQTAEAQAADKIRAIDDAAQRDRMAHSQVPEAPQFLDMFVRRVAATEAERRAAASALADAQAQSAAARAAVAEARAAAEAVETLIAERAAAEEIEANRRDQHALDDMTRGRSPRTARPGAKGSA